jgi:hypothetical protein
VFKKLAGDKGLRAKSPQSAKNPPETLAALDGKGAYARNRPITGAFLPIGMGEC